MNRFGMAIFASLLGAATLLSGCGSDGNTVAGIDRGGLRGVYGSITGFGSVIVNGVHYDTGSADIRVDGASATEADLEVGYVITIAAEVPGDGSAPQALSIDFDHTAIGTLSSVDTAANRAMILGQTVNVTDSTVYGTGIDPASIDGLALLAPDEILRISGFAGADGEVLATRIDIAPPGSGLEVTGVIANLDTVLQTFDVGGLVVRYQSANLQNFPNGQPENGDRAKAEGDTLDAGNALVATEVERKEIELEVDSGDELEVEGLITSFSSPAQFSISGIDISADASTNFENGDSAMLGLDVRVEIEGSLDGNGVLIADDVEFKPDGPLRIEANVDAVSPLQVLGITVQTNEQTIFEDKSPAELRPFSLADIRPADPVRIIGYESPAGSGVVVATGVTRTEPLEKLKLRGIAENLAEPLLSILEVQIVTDGNTDIEDDFFATAEGRLVEAIGDTSGGMFVAEKVEIKD